MKCFKDYKKSTCYIKLLKENGWELARVEGSHHHFKHATIKGIVSVPHPKNSFPQKTLKSIFKQAGLEIK